MTSIRPARPVSPQWAAAKAAEFRRQIDAIDRQPKATSWRGRARRAEVLSRLRRWEARYRQAAGLDEAPDWDAPF